MSLSFVVELPNARFGLLRVGRGEEVGAQSKGQECEKGMDWGKSRDTDAQWGLGVTIFSAAWITLCCLVASNQPPPSTRPWTPRSDTCLGLW